MPESAATHAPAAGPHGGVGSLGPRLRSRPLPRLTWWHTLVVSTRTAFADLAATHTPASWMLGWLGRVLMQVIFFALIGVLLGDPAAVRYLFIGNAVLLTAMETMLVVASTTWERRAGTLPLLVAAPGRLWPVFVGRSVQWMPSGVATASVALFIVGPFFGVRFDALSGALTFLLLVLVALTTYGFGLTVSAVVLRFMTLRNWATNLSYTFMMLVCGVVVPVGFWPIPVQTIAQTIPLTHALAAIRELIDAPTGSHVLVHTGLAVLTGALWFIIAAALLEQLAESGRRTGAIEFADD